MEMVCNKNTTQLEVLTLETHQCVDIESNRKCKKCMFKKDGQQEGLIIDVSCNLDVDIILNYILCR